MKTRIALPVLAALLLLGGGWHFLNSAGVGNTRFMPNVSNKAQWVVELNDGQRYGVKE